MEHGTLEGDDLEMTLAKVETTLVAAAIAP